MANKGNAPIIIKRKKVSGGGGHHGGAWKVAYADFVTAMMAFFMLMWLLNATTEQQRKGIADYFSPTTPVNRVSGGGSDMFGGDSIFSQETLAENGSGGSENATMSSPLRLEDEEREAQALAEVEKLDDLEESLIGSGGESLLSDEALRHVVTRLTDEGLIIEIFDLPDAALFETDADEPKPVTREIAAVLTRVMGTVTNDVALDGFVAAKSVLYRENPVWRLSSARAMKMRTLLEEAGLEPSRVQRVTGHADREPAARNPLSERNNRIEIVLLRSDQ